MPARQRTPDLEPAAKDHSHKPRQSRRGQGRRASSRRNWTQEMAPAIGAAIPAKSGPQRSLSPRLEDVLAQRQEPRIEAIPLVRSAYNRKFIAWAAAIGSAVVVVGIGWAAWKLLPTILPSHQATGPASPHHLVVPKTVVNPSKLAQLPADLQTSPSASSSATAPNSYIASLAGKSLPELASLLRAQISQLDGQQIDTKVVTHFAQLAETNQQQGKLDEARTNYLDGLELAHELQAIHDYYKK